MATVSLCIIVKNEEAVLARCLESIRAGVEEIIIVDTGSDDATKEIASRYTDLVYDFAWRDDFSAARNFSFSKASRFSVVSIKFKKNPIYSPFFANIFRYSISK